MQMISDSVGENGTNNASDAALVQAILLKARRPAMSATPNAPYLKVYDGDCGPNTKAAIRAFQSDHVFVSATRMQSVPNPRATAGLVRPGDATWEKLVANVDPAFADLRVLPGGKTVYVAATAEDLAARISAVRNLTFTQVFRTKVIECLNRMYELHGIALGVCREGDRRTFQTQYDLLTSGRNVTHAGPGESNHNFGMAVDLGFERLRWLQRNGDVTENETSWLHILNPNQNIIGPEALKFWQAMRAVGTSPAVGAFRGPEGDRPHLQNWNDAGVDMATRLADLLTRSGTMQWRGARQAYSCDLGFGGEFFAVGSAQQIWNRQATVTAEVLTRARAQGQPHANAANAQGGGTTAAPAAQRVTQADVTAMQQTLRADFDAADANWQNWTPS